MTDYTILGEFLPICEAVDKALTEYCGEQDWIPEQTLASPEGYGGMCDLHCQDYVVDFKTKDGDVSKARGYGEQGMQLAAYRRALLGPDSDARLLNVFISRQFDQFPTVTIFEHTDPFLWQKFECLLRLQHINDRHGPAYDALMEGGQ
jgi:hypothetical protein